ncbi:hypothetical protein ACQEVY_18805 [Streptomyces sp. CA-288835]|uniref:hypothetical protein n=1 Tax=Streptomyces sp. CA-288835 TaxID=3240069 RepID=UPI003D948686
MEPTAPATTYPFSHGKWLIAVRAARAPAGLERGGDRSAGPAGGRAARGERSEPPRTARTALDAVLAGLVADGLIPKPDGR